MMENRFVDQPADYVGGGKDRKAMEGYNTGYCHINDTRKQLLERLNRKHKK